MEKKPFVTLEQLKEIDKTYPTPYHIYDEKGIRENVKKLREAFSWNKGFREYFAVKATPNPFLVNILKEYDCGVDCSSLTELMFAKALDFDGQHIMFSSNATPAEEFEYAHKINATINLDDFTHIQFLDDICGIPETISCRFNPGGYFQIANSIMDNPGDAKYGFTKEQLIEGFKILKQKGARHFGIHAFLASNTVTNEYYPTLAKILGDVAIYTELGRFMMGPYGHLVTKAIHEKHTYKEYIGCDACAANLMRPAMYGAYHHITVMGKENEPCDHKYDVTGSLCENNDKFAIDRMLPKIDMGDFLVIHDTGAHGFSMGYNYNGKLRSAELLLCEDGSVKMIRRAETPKDYFATFDCFHIFDKVLEEK